MEPHSIADTENITRVEELFSYIRFREKFDLRALKSFAESHDIDFYNVRNAKGETVLHRAAGLGRQTLVKDQIEHRAKINARDIEGKTPLHCACNHVHKTVASMLIVAGADVNLKDNEGWTAMHCALERRDHPSYWDIVKLLVERGANPYITTRSNINCFSKIKDKSKMRELCLHYIKVKLKPVDDERESIINKYLRIKDFFEIISISDSDEDCKLVNSLITPRLVESRLGTVDNITPLHRAAGKGFIKIAKILIDSGADVNAKDDLGRIPLHNAAEFGHTPMIGLLADYGSEMNVTDNFGNTPIHYAAGSKYITTSLPCEKLLRLGADITTRNDDQKLPIDLANNPVIQEMLRLSNENFDIQQIHETSLDYPLNDLIDENSGLIRETVIEHLPRANSRNRPGIAKILLDEDGWLYQIVRQKMLDTIGYHSGDKYSSYDINSIEFVLNDQLLNIYAYMCGVLGCQNVAPNEKLLFHGSKSINKIISQGFNERYADQNGMFGAGIYFASHSSKSNQYTFGLNQGCPLHKDKSCYLCERVLILAQVALGNCQSTENELPDIRQAEPGYTSVSGRPGPNLKYPEYAIYDGKLAYPSYVIKYRLKF